MELIFPPGSSTLGDWKLVKLVKISSKESSKESVGLIQWIYTTDVINCFYDIKDETNGTLIQFDIVDYYPPISRESFTLALDYTTEDSDLSKEEVHIIINARISILIHNESGDQFDIAMG